jgi:glycerol kinase
MGKVILALDQGTTSSRAIVFSHDGTIQASVQREISQILPEPGFVEHEPEEIWESQIAVARLAIERAGVGADDVAAIGIANQRETTILWNRQTGQPVANAIVWQSRASAPICHRLKVEGHEQVFRERTGLVLDAYLSGTKITYLLEKHPELAEAARRGDILFGTVDTWLAWKLSGGRLHITDPSNASRTLLYNIHSLDWDDELLRILGVPRAMLPEVRPSSEVYGEADAQWLGRPIPIGALAGDQQAATFGQACFEAGSAKNTYGTGCFLLLNTGNRPVQSENNLLTTIGWQLGGEITYCLEGSVFIAGAVVQWLRDGLGVISSSSDVERLASTVHDSGGIYFVPALVGLGAPHWDPDARGTILGITRGTTAGHIARAAVESMAYQTVDLVDAMQRDAGIQLHNLRVDGGASVNNQLMQFQADLLGVNVRRPVVSETTALGAAYLAGLAVGYWKDMADIARNWALDSEFKPRISTETREASCHQWREAVRRSLGWGQFQAPAEP